MLSRERIGHLDQIGLTLSASAGFDFRSAEYRQLFDRARDCVPAPALNIQILRSLVPSCSIEPTVVTARESKGRLKLVLPLIVRDRARVRMIEATQHMGVGDYSAPIVVNDLCLDEAALALVRSELPNILPHHDTVCIRNIREEHVPIWQKLFGGHVRSAGFSAHATVLPESPRAWRERGLDSSFRKYVDSKKRRFSNAGKARLQRIEEPSEVSEAIRDRKAAPGALPGRFATEPRIL